MENGLWRKCCCRVKLISYCHCLFACKRQTAVVTSLTAIIIRLGSCYDSDLISDFIMFDQFCIRDFSRALYVKGEGSTLKETKNISIALKT